MATQRLPGGPTALSRARCGARLLTALLALTPLFAAPAPAPDPLHVSLAGWADSAARRDELRAERTRHRAALPASLTAVPATLRRAAPLLRAHADAFADPRWEPLETPLAPGVHGHRWQAPGKTVVTLLNENETPASLTFRPPGGVPPGAAAWDAWTGTRLSPAADGALTLTLEARAPGVVIFVAAGAPAPVVARPHRAFDASAEDARRRVMDTTEAGALWIQRRRDRAIWNDRFTTADASLLVEETGFRTRVTADACAAAPTSSCRPPTGARCGTPPKARNPATPTKKIPLLAPGLDRAANFGFRCAADAVR